MYTTELYKTYTEYLSYLPLPNFAMMFDWRSTHANMWRHHLMTLYNREPAKYLSGNFYSKEIITNIYASFGDYYF